MNKILTLLLLSLLLSCQDKKKDGISHLVKEWQGKEILFPEKMTYTLFGEDTVDFKMHESKHKILVYVDTMGCTGCKLQLSKWKGFISRTDSITGSSVPFIFVFQPQREKEVEFLLKREDFDRPVCIDTDGHFNRLNKIPGNSIFQTFLLDENNKVKVIGNPIHNLSIQDIYIREITKASHAEKLPITSLECPSGEYDLGTVTVGSTKSITVSVKNIGSNTFKLKGFTTSCDCTEATCDWKELQPGEAGMITINYKAEEVGDFYRTIDIYGNIKGSLTLSLIGEVKK